MEGGRHGPASGEEGGRADRGSRKFKPKRTPVSHDYPAEKASRGRRGKVVLLATIANTGMPGCREKQDSDTSAPLPPLEREKVVGMEAVNVRLTSPFPAYFYPHETWQRESFF